MEREAEGSKLVVFAAFGLACLVCRRVAHLAQAEFEGGGEEASASAPLRARLRPFVTVGRTLFYIRVLYNAED